MGAASHLQMGCMSMVRFPARLPRRHHHSRRFSEPTF
jgi:hypothetical protein